MKTSDPNKTYELLLINPRQTFMHYATQIEMVRILGKKVPYANLALPTIAGLTPDNYNIHIVDENIESIPDDIYPDLVGISTYLASSDRCFEIADGFREKKIQVIFGGPYVTYCPEEGLKHADSVVIGEAEGLWQECLADFEKGKLKGVYKTESKVPFESNAIPRWDLLDTSKIMSVSVQTRRGCPYKCEFCLVSQMFGRKVRYRDIDNVIEELKILPLKKLIFVDDNFIMNRKYTLELLRRMKPLGLSWTCQASVDVTLDDELLDKMAEAGCNFIVIGFESLNEQSIAETHKDHNKRIDYSEALQRIHKKGMNTYASFIVGFDHDKLDEFDRIIEFSIQAQIPYIMVSILGITPGTELFNRMDKAGRWVKDTREYGGGMFPVMHYQQMSQTELFERYVETLECLYDFKTIYQRSIDLFKQGYFTRENLNDPPPVSLKIKTTFLVFKEFIFSTNNDKRKLFFEIFSLIRNKKMSIDAAAPFLLSMIGINRHIKKIRRNMPEFLDAIAAVDRGPWKERYDKSE